MNIEQAYNQWAAQYDYNQNKTRDLEAVTLRQTLQNHHFNRTLEIGCGTGKNTVWLQTVSNQIVAVDLSAEMLEKARSKVSSKKVSFHQANILEDWTFATGNFDLISFSLVLEHIENLVPVLEKAATLLAPKGHLYISELHPFKQYSGSKARFETATGTQVVPCFNHHFSDFIAPLLSAGLQLEKAAENFDEEDRNNLPRLLTLLFCKR